MRKLEKHLVKKPVIAGSTRDMISTRRICFLPSLCFPSQNPLQKPAKALSFHPLELDESPNYGRLSSRGAGPQAASMLDGCNGLYCGLGDEKCFELQGQACRDKITSSTHLMFLHCRCSASTAPISMSTPGHLADQLLLQTRLVA
jgi:hypothetical protein